MSLDEKAEEELYAALQKVWGLPHRLQRRRILTNVVRSIMIAMKWPHVALQEEPDEPPTKTS